MSDKSILPSSFRDPGGFLFHHQGTLYRQVNKSCRNHYEKLIDSGLYEDLAASRLLIPHEESDLALAQTQDAYRILKPQLLPFISYPYEWCFGQYKDAALATLEVQKTALTHGMSLRDASAYNVQFSDGRPVLIDTLSFEIYREGAPWVAYAQFCRHFLAPLALMAHVDARMGTLMQVYIDGVPLDLAASLLPGKTRFKFSLMTHIHLHARSQQRYAGRRITADSGRVTKRAMLGLIDSLESGVKKLTVPLEKTTWSEYYDETNYSDEGMAQKAELVADYVRRVKPSTVWDLGANTGRFSRVAAQSGSSVVAFDSDPAAVEANYRRCLRDNEKQILPLVLDLTNPSPAIGWHNRERMSLSERGKVDLVLALALVHHLAIANNLPLNKLAEFFAELGSHLIVEFVPKSDSQVQRLLGSREDIFDNYTRPQFEKAFEDHFDITDSHDIEDSERTLYLMHRR